MLCQHNFAEFGSFIRLLVLYHSSRPFYGLLFVKDVNDDEADEVQIKQGGPSSFCRQARSKELEVSSSLLMVQK